MKRVVKVSIHTQTNTINSSNVTKDKPAIARTTMGIILALVPHRIGDHLHLKRGSITVSIDLQAALVAAGWAEEPIVDMAAEVGQGLATAMPRAAVAEAGMATSEGSGMGH
jgi:hypothetical protein